MNRKELEKTLCVSSLYHNDGQLPTIYLPNEIFEDISDNASGNSKFVSSIYAFYFLITLLYRYAIYELNAKTLLMPTLKRILGNGKDNRSIDPIIKKDGILNLMGYTRHTSNYPIRYEFDRDSYDLDFVCINDKIQYDDGTEEYHIPRHMLSNYGKSIKIHYPIKAFERRHLLNGEECYLGTFFSLSNTHGVDLEMFLRCMSNKELGVEGFYLYGLIKSKSDFYDNYWNIPLKDLIWLSGMKATKFKAVLNTLREYQMILTDNMPWIVDRPSNVATKASGYKATTSEWFAYEKLPLPKHKKISWKKCQEEYTHAILGLDDLTGTDGSLPF
jgi:hypothetical protein